LINFPKNHYMDILVLSAHLPSPRAWQAGQKTSYYICESLARNHEVHLLSFATEDEVQSFREEDMKIFRSWDFMTVTKWTRFRGVLSAPRLPIAVAARFAQGFRQKVKMLLLNRSFDAAILDHVAMWQYRDSLGPISIVAGSAHDVLSQLWQRKADNAGPLLAPLLRWEGARVRNWEGDALESLSFVSAHCEKDARLFNDFNPRVPQCPIQPWCSVDAQARGLNKESSRQKNSIVFWGAMDRRENVDAVEFAVREILPRIQATFADFKFLIAGSHSEQLASLSRQNKSVHLTGFIEDIGFFLGSMQVALLPMRLGAGIKLKTLECMAAGVAVVTTPAGIEGIGGMRGKHYLLGETPEELASQVVRLLNSPEERIAIGVSGSELVRSEHDFAASMGRLNSFLGEMNDERQANMPSKSRLTA
jgi:glycosyltransferase involved in cell wall biosynthesis